MRSFVIAVAGCALVAGCDDSPTTKPNNPIVVRSEAQDQLHQLDDLNRAIALKRAIYASGFSCRRVTESGYVQEYGNLSMWTASCDDGTDWAIFAGPDGSAQVRRCADLAQFKLPECKISEATKPAAPSANRSGE